MTPHVHGSSLTDPRRPAPQAPQTHRRAGQSGAGMLSHAKGPTPLLSPVTTAGLYEVLCSHGAAPRPAGKRSAAGRGAAAPLIPAGNHGDNLGSDSRKSCYQCGALVSYLFADSRCGKCTRIAG